MKSLQVLKHIPANEHANYRDLEVLKSSAGWYVGTIYIDPETKFPDAGSRDTDFFEKEKDARFVLQILERLDISLKGNEYPNFIYDSFEEELLSNFDSMLHTFNLNPRNVGYRIDP